MFTTDTFILRIYSSIIIRAQYLLPVLQRTVVILIGLLIAGIFEKGVCSAVLWHTILSNGELLRNLKELHLVNNDPDVTRAILQEAHSSDISPMLTRCDSSSTGADTARDRGMDCQPEDAGRARSTGGDGSFSNSHSSKKSDGSMLTTFDPLFEKKPPNSMPEEEEVLVGGQWVPRSKVPLSTSLKSSNAPEAVERETRLAGSDSPSDAQRSKAGDRADDKKTLSSFTIYPSFGSSEQQPTQFRKDQSTGVVASGSTTKLACANCAREPNRQTSEWFVQLPCAHNFCLKCFNEHVNRTHTSKCSRCPREFELPSPANKGDFLFLPNPKGDSFVFNPNDHNPTVCHIHHSTFLYPYYVNVK